MLLPQWLGEPLAVVTHALAELNVQLGTTGLGSPGPTRPEVSLLILRRWKVGERFKRFPGMLIWYYPGLIFRKYNIWNFYFQVTKFILRASIIWAMRFIVLEIAMKSLNWGIHGDRQMMTSQEEIKFILVRQVPFRDQTCLHRLVSNRYLPVCLPIVADHSERRQRQLMSICFIHLTHWLKIKYYPRPPLTFSRFPNPLRQKSKS